MMIERRSGPAILSQRMTRAAGFGTLALLLASTAAAAQSVWNNPAQGNWTTGSNWTPSGAPTSTTDVEIDNGGEAQITVTGQQSSTITIGATNAGTLTITSGGELTTSAATPTIIGGSGSGAVTVTRSGSSWTNAGGLVVGDQSGGTGTLTVDLGATLTTNTTSGTGTILGNAAGSTGTAKVDGAGSTWTSGGPLTIGLDGSGTLTVSAGGAVSDTAATIASGSTSTSTAKVTGQGSLWQTSGELTIGAAGDGTLTIEAAGGATAATASLGTDGGGTGILKISGAGSSLAVTGGLTIGDAGTGSATVESGGLLSSATATLGNAATGSGTVKITGAGSKWTVTGATAIGAAGTGDVTIEAAATASTGATIFGTATGASGTAKITGTGSTWNVGGPLTVGDAGTGAITIEAGGKLESSGTTLGSAVGGSGDIKVTGGGSNWTDAGAVTIGAAGDGTLEVFVGASATTGATTLASTAGSTGSVAVTGEGSSWTTTGNLTIGQSGSGSVTLADGGAISVEGGTGTITLAANAGSTGTLKIGNASTSGTLKAAEIAGGAGTATIVFDQSDAFALGAKITGSTSVQQIGSGTTTLASSNSYDGTTLVQAGTLRAAADDALGDGSAVTVKAAGTLDLDGYDQTVASLANAGLVSLAGDVAGTTLDITGNLTGGGTIVLGAALGGDDSATDSLHIGGDVTGSTFLKIVNLGGTGAKTTGDGIEVVAVDGSSSSDAFALGRTISGAFAYYLYQGGLGTNADNGDWYLRSELSTPAQIYRAYPRTLLNTEVDAVGTLADRRGSDTPAPSGSAASWIRTVGSWRQEDPAEGSSFSQILGLAQAGYENDIRSGSTGSLTGGAILTVGHSAATVDTTIQGGSGNGHIDTTTAGLGASLTWRGADGTYADAVAQILLHDTDFSVSDAGGMKSDALALGATGSLELGRKITLGPGFSVTPQAQLIVSTVGTNGFEDADQADVGGAFNTEILGRTGVRVDYGSLTPTGSAAPWNAYAVVNLAYAFLGRTAIDVGATELDQSDSGLRGEAALGGTLRLSDRIRLYGQGAYQAAFDGSSSRWQAGLGLDIRW